MYAFNNERKKNKENDVGMWDIIIKYGP